MKINIDNIYKTDKLMNTIIFTTQYTTNKYFVNLKIAYLSFF